MDELRVPRGDVDAAIWRIPAAPGLALVHHRSGVSAVVDACPHTGCAFSEDGEVDGDILICNCHGAEFELPSGRVRADGPTDEDLVVRPVGEGPGDVLVVRA
jgi:nitrite reductase/ring-hydroxylating ferredoxin subunit